MSHRDDYRAFLAGLRLRHFSPEEVISYADQVRGGVRNDLPDRQLWDNLVPTLWVVDQLRAYLGAPITLTSIYRAPDYNRQVGGATGSMHLQNRAIDFQVAGVSPTEAFNRLKKMRDAGTFRGGLGKYSTFVHVDTRGNNATW